MKLPLRFYVMAAGIILFFGGFVPAKYPPVVQQPLKEIPAARSPGVAALLPQTAFTCAQPTGLASYLNPPDYEYTTLQWNAVSGAVSYSYELYYSYFTQGSFMFLIDEGEFNTHAYPIAAYTDLPGYYDWRIRTNCSGGSSAWSYGSFYLPN